MSTPGGSAVSSPNFAFLAGHDARLDEPADVMLARLAAEPESSERERMVPKGRKQRKSA